jgi:hypothetical protein
MELPWHNGYNNATGCIKALFLEEETEMERLHVVEAAMKYPQKWLVAVNISHEPECAVYGDIFLVTLNKDEAFATRDELRENGDMGEVMLITPYDDRPTVGG